MRKGSYSRIFTKNVAALSAVVSLTTGAATASTGVFPDVAQYKPVYTESHILNAPETSRTHHKYTITDSKRMSELAQDKSWKIEPVRSTGEPDFSIVINGVRVEKCDGTWTIDDRAQNASVDGTGDTGGSSGTTDKTHDNVNERAVAMTPETRSGALKYDRAA